MKKALSFVLSLALVLSVVACSAPSRDANAQENIQRAEVATAAGEIDATLGAEEGAIGEVGFNSDADIINDVPNSTSVANIDDSNDGSVEGDPSDQDKPEDGNEASDRMLITTINMEVETMQYDELIVAISDKINDLGGYIEESQVNSDSDSEEARIATYTIRIPQDYVHVFTSFVGISSNVLLSSEVTEDVTLQYVDIQSRIDSLVAQRDAITAMLAEADNLDDMLYLQDCLTDVIYEIDSYESQLRSLASLVSYSTIHLTVNEVLPEVSPTPTATPTPTPTPTPGPKVYEEYGSKISKQFNEACSDVLEALCVIFLDFVAVLPGLVVFLVFCGILVLIVVLITKLVKKSVKKRNKKDIIITPKVSDVPVVSEENMTPDKDAPVVPEVDKIPDTTEESESNNNNQNE